MATTTQQQRLVRSLLDAGFKRQQFSARTMIERRCDRGIRYSEYGPAYANARGRNRAERLAAERLFVEKAEWLAADPYGLEVTIFELAGGGTLASVRTTWANRGFVSIVKRDGRRLVSRVELRPEPSNEGSPAAEAAPIVGA